MKFLKWLLPLLSFNAIANEEVGNIDTKEMKPVVFFDPNNAFLQKVRAKYHLKFKEEFIYDKLSYNKDIHLMSIEELATVNCNHTRLTLESPSFEIHYLQVLKEDDRLEKGFIIVLKKEKIGFHASYENARKYRNNGNASYFYDLSTELKKLYELKEKSCEEQKILRLKNIKKEEQLKIWEERSK